MYCSKCQYLQGLRAYKFQEYREALTVLNRPLVRRTSREFRFLTKAAEYAQVEFEAASKAFEEHVQNHSKAAIA
jgi:hypothetical protein